MRISRLFTAAAAALGLMAGAAMADTVKVGIIGPFSGPFAFAGQNFKYGIDAFVAQNGDMAGDSKVEFVYRDLDGVDPAKAKALAQELIVKDKVQYLGGIYFTPNALAVAPLLEQGQVPLVVFNAATSAITEASPYVVRSSFTMWQNTVPGAKVAAREGHKKAFIAVSDYGPGIDTEKAFQATFEGEGGEVVEAVRMPLKTTDFSPIMQRIKDSGADMVFAFLPSGPPTLAFVKSFIDNGLKDEGIALMTTGDVTVEPDLPAIGDAGLGIVSTYHYAVSHDSPENEAFLKAVEEIGGKRGDVAMTAVGAYDGAFLIYKMIEATGGKRDPQAAVDAVKGLEWTSPRGPVSIDPETRHIRQTVYLRVVDKEGDTYINRETESFPDQPDYGLMQKK